MEPRSLAYNWATLFLWDINRGPGPSGPSSSRYLATLVKNEEEEMFAVTVVI
jgi:hypothetical protein